MGPPGEDRGGRHDASTERKRRAVDAAVVPQDHVGAVEAPSPPGEGAHRGFVETRWGQVVVLVVLVMKMVTVVMRPAVAVAALSLLREERDGAVAGR